MHSRINMTLLIFCWSSTRWLTHSDRGAKNRQKTRDETFFQFQESRKRATFEAFARLSKKSVKIYIIKNQSHYKEHEVKRVSSLSHSRGEF